MIIRRRDHEDYSPPDPAPPPVRHHLDKRAGELAEEGAAAGVADDLLNSTELAEWLGVSVQFVEIARHQGRGPRFIRISARRVRYRRADVLAWLAERQHRHTAEYARRPSATRSPADAA